MHRGWRCPLVPPTLRSSLEVLGPGYLLGDWGHRRFSPHRPKDSSSNGTHQSDLIERGSGCRNSRGSGERSLPAPTARTLLGPPAAPTNNVLATVCAAPRVPQQAPARGTTGLVVPARRSRDPPLAAESGVTWPSTPRKWRNNTRVAPTAASANRIVDGCVGKCGVWNSGHSSLSLVPPSPSRWKGRSQLLTWARFALVLFLQYRSLELFLCTQPEAKWAVLVGVGVLCRSFRPTEPYTRERVQH